MHGMNAGKSKHETYKIPVQEGIDAPPSSSVDWGPHVRSIVYQGSSSGLRALYICYCFVFVFVVVN